MRIRSMVIISILLLSACSLMAQDESQPYVLALGVAQDGGYPHPGCSKECCTLAWENPGMAKNITSLALVDPGNKKWYLFEATPDITKQLHYFESLTGGCFAYLPDAIFVSHAHTGHYTGLMILGKEAMNAKDVIVYALPRMKEFLKDNGPWSQLVTGSNIKLPEIHLSTEIELPGKIRVEYFTVPHRDEYSETAGYRLITPGKVYLFIPDIDKWEKWDRIITSEVENCDIAFLDGTFYSSGEVPGRNISDIPHPFITETMEHFSTSPDTIKNRIKFIHLNHSNPAIYNEDIRNSVRKEGFDFAVQGNKY